MCWLPLPAAPIGLERRTVASRSCDQPNVWMQQCLGESQQKEKCRICKGFCPRTLKDREQRLKILLMEVALRPHSDLESIEPAPSTSSLVRSATATTALETAPTKDSKAPQHHHGLGHKKSASAWHCSPSPVPVKKKRLGLVDSCPGRDLVESKPSSFPGPPRGHTATVDAGGVRGGYRPDAPPGAVLPTEEGQVAGDCVPPVLDKPAMMTRRSPSPAPPAPPAQIEGPYHFPDFAAPLTGDPWYCSSMVLLLGDLGVGGRLLELQQIVEQEF
ncbi:hypothetical protein UY3_06062 [Chelonia mydas]|uniref:Uncharacterized protein n=1 Tax=Chelonia mydas TaxID=8469 RepID=M7BFP1_CHEMY|nr:hypothetical protein UY3_06062 [Chelonia mydas]